VRIELRTSVPLGFGIKESDITEVDITEFRVHSSSHDLSFHPILHSGEDEVQTYINNFVSKAFVF
jgi:hypothetical protein